MPILSRSVLADGSREFRREWQHARHIKEGLAENELFIFPVVIDDVDRNSDRIHEWMRKIDWEEAGPDLRLGDGMIARLKAAYRVAQVRAQHG